MSRRLSITVAALMAVLCTASVAQDNPPIISGIWEHGNSVLLFADFPSCEGAYKPLQTLVSEDGGKTWAKSGPRLIGSALMFVLDTGDELWLAGENFVEGPSGPFLLLYDPDNREWPQFEMYNENGTADLLALARDERDGNRFLAWLELDLLDPGPDPVYLYESLDRGRTWHVVKRVKDAPKSAPGLRFFEELPQQSRNWRISNPHQPKSALERRESDGKWHQVAKLPLPIQESCEN